MDDAAITILGGTIHDGSRVARILVTGDRGGRRTSTARARRRPPWPNRPVVMRFRRYGYWKEPAVNTPELGDPFQAMRHALPGLQNPCLCGRRVGPGGGRESGVMTARRLVKAVCKEGGRTFRAGVASPPIV